MSYHAFLLCAITPVLLPGLLAAQAAPGKPLQKGEFRLSCERARVSVTSNEASSERRCLAATMCTQVYAHRVARRCPGERQ